MNTNRKQQFAFYGDKRANLHCNIGVSSVLVTTLLYAWVTWILTCIIFFSVFILCISYRFIVVYGKIILHTAFYYNIINSFNYRFYIGFNNFLFCVSILISLCFLLIRKIHGFISWYGCVTLNNCKRRNQTVFRTIILPK